VSASADLLSEFNHFAANVSGDESSLFAVRDLSNVDDFISKMQFLHTATDSNSPYANVVVLLLWNMSASHLVEPKRPDAVHYRQYPDPEDFPRLYIDKFKETIAERWKKANDVSLNGDAILGRISRMSVLPMHAQEVVEASNEDGGGITLQQLFTYSPPGAPSTFKLLYYFFFDELPSKLRNKSKTFFNILRFKPSLQSLWVQFDIVAMVGLMLLVILSFLCFCVIDLCLCSGRRKRKHPKQKVKVESPFQQRTSADFASPNLIAPPVQGYPQPSTGLLSHSYQRSSPSAYQGGSPQVYNQNNNAALPTAYSNLRYVLYIQHSQTCTNTTAQAADAVLLAVDSSRLADNPVCCSEPRDALCAVRSPTQSRHALSRQRLPSSAQPRDTVCV
jgi:hypothetical protein